MKQPIVLLVIMVHLCSCAGSGSNENKAETTEEDTPSKEVTKSVSFKYPLDRAILSSPLVIEMKVEGMEIEPAGEVNEGKGHHHLIINGPFIEKGVVVPANETHLHYGLGQIKAEINLEPGRHTLTLQFADGIHVSYGEEMSATIEIEIVNQ
jgi:hypothetical protein